MTFESFAAGHSLILWLAFGIALIMGAVVNKTNFCTMGAVSDVVNMGDSSRMRAWVLAMAIAMLGVTIFEAMAYFSVDVTRPPYRGSNFAWLEYVIGGVMFGVGMTLGSGCGNKTLIRIGGGNIKSVIVLAIIGVCAYYMINPFPGTDKTIYSEVFYPWTSLASISLSGKQDISGLINSATSIDLGTLRLVIGLLVVAMLTFIVFRSSDFRSNKDNIIGGTVVGFAVLAAWYISGGFATISADGDTYSWVQYASDDVWSLIEEGKRPPAVAVQSFTFINPMGETYGYVLSGFSASVITFGLMTLFGVISGSFLWSLVSKSFRIEWFVDFKDFKTHFIGAVLMGVGGVLSLGCTFGQGITGISTLSVGSIIAFASIVFGSALTMKIQYYKMCYEDEATFPKALVTALVDMRFLPAGMRKLDAI